MKTLLPIAVVLTVFGFVTAAGAQQASKVSKIGFLSASNPASLARRVEAFRQGLKELGYIEGKNIVLETRWAEGKIDRLPSLAAELERLKVDVIVSAGPTATHGARQGAGTTPIVMMFDADPVGSGFVTSLARPGGNITGLSSVAPEISGKQLDVLKQIIPGLARVAILADSREPAYRRSLQEVDGAARVLGLQIHHLDIRESRDLENAFQSLRKERADALVILPMSMAGTVRAQIAALALKNRLPVMYPWAEFVDAGGLMTYSVNMEDLARRAAIYVDKILKGSKPAELPVEQPYKFELVINLKTAKQIGLTIPVSVLTRADRVIKE